jgi:hypothetical protein
MQNSSLKSLFKLGVDPNWAFSHILHRFLNICVPIKTLKTKKLMVKQRSKEEATQEFFKTNRGNMVYISLEPVVS